MFILRVLGFVRRDCEFFIDFFWGSVWRDGGNFGVNGVCFIDIKFVFFKFCSVVCWFNLFKLLVEVENLFLFFNL